MNLRPLLIVHNAYLLCLCHINLFLTAQELMGQKEVVLVDCHVPNEPEVIF